jgi:hypothetical protein
MRRIFYGILILIGLGLLIGGIMIYRHARVRSVVSPASTIHVAAPFRVGDAFPTPQLIDRDGRQQPMAWGSHLTVVLAVAPDSMISSYDVRYVAPVVAQWPGVHVDVIDVEALGGLASAGPRTPAFHGHNVSGEKITTTQMVTLMRRFVTTPRLSSYVAPASLRQAWHVSTVPIWTILNDQHRVLMVIPGGITLSTARQILTRWLLH